MKYKIEELCEINSENISKSDDIKYIYYLDTSNLTRGTINEIQKLIVGKDKLPSRAKRKVKVNDILISTVRPNQRHYGIIRKEIENLIVSTGFAVLSPNLKKVNPEYLYWYLTQDSIVNYLQSIAETSTSAYPSIKPSVIGGLEIDLPKLEEQKAIANILSTLDEKIETNNQINEKLEEMAQALFKHWFVDFEFPNENGKPYKSSGGEMVESELGMIPKGWEVSSLDKIADYLNGLPMQKYIPKEDELSLPVLKIKELRNGEPDINSDRCSANIEDKYIINDGDIIFSWSGTLMIDIWCGGKCGLNQHLFKVTSQKYNKWFYYFWIKRHLDRFINIANSKATTMGHIKRKDLTDSKVLIPTSNVYEKANEILGTIINDIINLKIESKKLKAVRDILLPKLMSGEIRVPLDNENLVEQS
ncbi:restriction endonuclease subunit S [Weizmannia sp. FSL W8-0676]|uniref:restriction endonuclease subunit S n=1 Tax=Weizmannia sp. FSL W8-0676 TaxID=2954703 RepID=UPI003158B6F3